MTATREPRLTGNAMQILQARYLLKDSSGNLIETPGHMLARVARCVASAETKYVASRKRVENTARKFLRFMLNGVFFPNSPTLMNAQRRFGMLSACFVLPIQDSIDSIFESVKHTAQIQKAGGGTGFSLDRLRPTGDYITSSGGKTSGPISFWRVFSEATRAIQQGAFRRGANMVMMHVGHPDILKFINAKNDLREFENFNISVKVGYDFMRTLHGDPERLHEVVNPRTGGRYLLPRGLEISGYSLDDLVPAGTKTANCHTVADVWQMIVNGAWRTGEPGLCFIDRVNADNPTPQLGRIEATNPCGEQPLLDYEACNLGSINVAKFVRHGMWDEAAFRDAIRLGVRFLDDVIDVNYYVIPAIDELCKGNRKIGLGIMGFADALFELGIAYNSEQALRFAHLVAEVLTNEAFAESERLAGNRGTFPNWSHSAWRTVHGRPMRNAAVTTIAPTGTISILAGCSGGIEPAYALAFFRRILDGKEMLEVNGPFRRYAEKRGFWSEELARALAGGAALAEMSNVDDEAKRVFVTVHEIAPAWHVKMQAAFQDRIDGAISKTINLPNDASIEDVERVYQLAYDLKCKGVTVYRDGCRSKQPMTTSAQLQVRYETCPQCGAALPREPGCALCSECGARFCEL